jgi:hypothetical protein
MRFFALIIAILASVSTAHAQTGVGQLPARNVVGNPTGSPAPPTAFPIFSTANAWTQPQSIIVPPITSAANDLLTSSAPLYARKTVQFGTPGGASTGIFAAIYADNVIGEGTWSSQVGVIGNVINSNTQHSQPASTASAVGTYGVGVCAVAACSSTWGGVMAAYDLSGQTPAINPLIGLEVDNYAHGPGGGIRVGLQIVADTPDHMGTLNSLDSGILFSGSGAASTGQFVNLINGGTAKTTHGVDLGAMTITGNAWISPGSFIDNIGNATFRVITVNNGINVNGQAAFGGLTANSILLLASSANVAPSGDSVVVRSSSIQLQNALATSTYAVLTPSLITLGDGAPTHLATAQTTPPALTSCGTGSPTITGTDTAGIVTMGTTASGCIITFNVAYNAAPFCVVTWIATPLASQSYVTSASAITLTQTATTGNAVQYHCIARNGG